jgi:hypothetical protein
MNWPTMAGCLFAAGICAFIIGGYRVSLRSGMLGRSMLQNVGLSKQERAVLRDRFGSQGGLDRWLIFGGAVSCVGAVVALNALVGQG